jgi:hypothetical protein
MSNRQRNNRTKRNAKPKRKDTRTIRQIGVMQPHAYPFVANKRVVKRCLRFFVAGVTTDATGNFVHRVSLRNLQRAFDGSGTYVDAANLAQVYDCYKPVWLRIQTVPTFAINNFSVGSITMCVDDDDNDTSQVIATVSDAIGYGEVATINSRDSSLTTFKIRSLSSGTIPGTVTTSPATILSGGFLDFNGPPFEGVVYMVGGNFPANLPVLDLFLEMDVLLQLSR